MNSHEVFIHIHQGCFAGTGAIIRLPQCQWSKPDGYGKISQCITTTKHSKAKNMCIFLGIYCMTIQPSRHFKDDIVKWLFMNEMFCIVVQFSLKFGSKCPIDNKSALVRGMAWRRAVHWCIYALGGADLRDLMSIHLHDRNYTYPRDISITRISLKMRDQTSCFHCMRLTF